MDLSLVLTFDFELHRLDTKIWVHEFQYDNDGGHSLCIWTESRKLFVYEDTNFPLVQERVFRDILILLMFCWVTQGFPRNIEAIALLSKNVNKINSRVTV